MTWLDLGMRSKEDSWRRIRAARGNPPGGFGLERAAVFDAALEQAQQQFLAAAGIGYDSRPLNLFYGLSQAGRAISTVLAPAGEPFELRGHGISSPNLQQVCQKPRTRLIDLTVISDGRANASFTRLSQLLESPLLEEPEPVARLWGMLLEPQMHEPLALLNSQVLIAQGRRMSSDPQTFAIEGISRIPWELDGMDSSRFNAFLHPYPALHDVQFHRQSGRSSGHDNCPPTLSIEVRVPIEPSDPGPLGIDYRGASVILPAVTGGSGAMHPLMIWWSILYALSMLARYQPRAWVELIDVSRSQHAVAIEYLLDVAQDSVPDLVARAIETAMASDTGT
jgi:YaaC-like Protein